MSEKELRRDKSHTSQTPPGNEFYKETEIQKPEALTSSRSPRMLGHNTLSFDQTVNKSSEHIFPEERCEIHKPEALTSSTTLKMLRYNTLSFDQTVNKSSEHIFLEERSEGTEPPKISTIATGTEARENWGLAIDRGARVFFPFSYIIFTVLYFVVMLKSDGESK
ncbi:uncharacterized protein LOC111344875 [Stylophora pistillata]|nr:uncharacterized protein LOC111344875 [Stylophora pistillata]